MKMPTARAAAVGCKVERRRATANWFPFVIFTYRGSHCVYATCVEFICQFVKFGLVFLLHSIEISKVDFNYYLLLLGLEESGHGGVGGAKVQTWPIEPPRAIKETTNYRCISSSARQLVPIDSDRWQFWDSIIEIMSSCVCVCWLNQLVDI